MVPLGQGQGRIVYAHLASILLVVGMGLVLYQSVEVVYMMLALLLLRVVRAWATYQAGVDVQLVGRVLDVLVSSFSLMSLNLLIYV
jgi:hypothetical protein